MNNDVIAIIPAAGRGSRLAPYPGPKELFPIGWQPYSLNGETHRRPKVVSQYIVESMARAGIGRLLVIVGEHKYDLLRYYGSGRRFRVDIAYLFQSEPTGMLPAVDLAYPWACKSRVVLGMPDTVIQPPDAVGELLEAHRRRSADLTLGLFATARPWKFGMIGVDATGRVTTHVDKPAKTDLTLMWGLAVWEPSFTDLIHALCRHNAPTKGREPILGDAIDEALARGLSVWGHRFEPGFYMDIGTYDEIVEAQHALQEDVK